MSTVKRPKKEGKPIVGDAAPVEQRLAALERAVASLEDQLSRALAPDNWIERVAGSISDEAAFLEALEFGRAYRQADRPSEDPPGRP